MRKCEHCYPFQVGGMDVIVHMNPHQELTSTDREIIAGVIASGSQQRGFNLVELRQAQPEEISEQVG